MEVWAVCEWHNCSGDEMVGLDGTPVVVLCATEQLADQIVSKRGYGYAAKMRVATNMREAAHDW